MMANSDESAGERGKRRSMSVPVIEESLSISKRQIEKGRIAIKKNAEEREQTIDEPLFEEQVKVRRVPINRLVDEPTPIREVDGTTIIPIFEEVPVVNKQLILKEELHITKIRSQVHKPQRIKLRRETVEIEKDSAARSVRREVTRSRAMARTVIGLFSSHSEAERAVQELGSAGFARKDIEVMEGNSTGAVPGANVGNLVRMGVPQEEVRHYSESLARGRTVVALKTDETRGQQAVVIFERCGAKDLDQRQSGAESVSAAMSQAPRAGSSSQSEAARIPVVEEELQVGKREIQRGGVRVYSHISEQPVEKEVSLRQEHVNVERHPVNRPATEQDVRGLKEGSIEVRETAEEPVVTKQARVVEEVVVSKEVAQENRKVADTVRRSHVDVDENPATSLDKAGATDVGRNKDYAYAYAETLATDPRYRGKNWNAIEPDAQRGWLDQKKGTWEEFKEKIRNAWEKMSGQ